MREQVSRPGLEVERRRPEVVASDATREKLVEAAGRVFARRGYYSTTVREICAKAGANVAAVNYHFGDKLGLYTEVLEQSVRAAQLDAVRNAFEKTAPPEEILRAVIRARLRALCSGDLPARRFRILTHEMAQPSPAFQHFVN